MQYRTVPYTTGLADALSFLPGPGLFLVAPGQQGEPPNAMTIGWGTVGIIWGKPIFSVLVRFSRHTFGLMEAADSFTVCVPAPEHLDALNFCGTRSGRDHDKFTECGLGILPSTTVSAPGIAGSPMVYECKIVHKNDVLAENLDPGIKSRSYPAGDLHRVYYGEILALQVLPNVGEIIRGR